jgi:hypothetical protein
MLILQAILSQNAQTLVACMSGLKACFRVSLFPILMAWMTMEKWLQILR